MPESRVTLFIFKTHQMSPTVTQIIETHQMSPTVTQIIETRDAAAVTHLSKRAMSPTSRP